MHEYGELHRTKKERRLDIIASATSTAMKLHSSRSTTHGSWTPALRRRLELCGLSKFAFVVRIWYRQAWGTKGGGEHMFCFRRFTVAALATIAALAFDGSARADGPDPSILTANAGFYAALNRLFVGEVEPMKAVWSHADDVSYMGPTGQFEAGWAAVLKDWEGQAVLKLGGKVGPSEMRVLAGSDLAVVSCYEVGENTNAAGKVEQLKLRATSIFRKEGGIWKMVGHQTDKLPYLAK